MEVYLIIIILQTNNYNHKTPTTARLPTEIAQE